jgi:hypothetical protein
VVGLELEGGNVDWIGDREEQPADVIMMFGYKITKLKAKSDEYDYGLFIYANVGTLLM